MGSGKSTVGALVAARAGVPHRDLDTLIEERVGTSIADLFASRGEAAFRALETELLAGALEGDAVVSLGGGAVLADANWALIRSRALTVWLDAPLTVLMARAGVGQVVRPLLNGRTEAQAQAVLEARLPRYSAADHRVDAVAPATVVAEEVYRLWVG
ncbi:MAG: shikimate kinase [Candidatus Nephthysia bennettiae]|uniref:Shikimate kinase n=1 Tax=Candidatus Nephthysia bennettiae TaxID=3127016 RepID=A0A934KEI5_9BACT|nr:shikimate kinase [Candidatus Dormibacteraeota bacterium]MBJ7611169.1 shikimate kinase [Candidatus Dormibacteraeota bacterium]PZR90628.1 MAG: shikimate kinase [Candidatus Dormibacteraeota bacterium]